MWAFISLWRRFIDDIFGIRSGTKDQFHNFVTELNSFAASYGIQFGNHAIGPSVNFLDVTLSINETSKLIEYKLFVKPTDSRLYLRTESFTLPMCSVEWFSLTRDLTATSLPPAGPQLQAPEVLPSQPGRAEDWEIKENEEI